MNDIEEWKSLSFLGFDNYSVSSLGRVMSYNKYKNGRIMTPHIKDGYEVLKLVNKYGKNYTWFVHRLVCHAFIPNPHNYPCVNHKDFVRNNNCVSNLEWCDNLYNLSYSNLLRPVCKYSLSGKFICRYDTISSAASSCGINARYLGNYLRNSNHRPSYKGYLWCYEGDSVIVPPTKIEKINIRTKLTPDEKRAKYREYYLLHADEIKARYKELRTWLTPVYVLKMYRDHISLIGEGNYEDEFKLWNNPNHDEDTFNFIKARIYKRFKLLDSLWLR